MKVGISSFTIGKTNIKQSLLQADKLNCEVFQWSWSHWTYNQPSIDYVKNVSKLASKLGIQIIVHGPPLPNPEVDLKWTNEFFNRLNILNSKFMVFHISNSENNIPLLKNITKRAEEYKIILAAENSRPLNICSGKKELWNWWQMLQVVNSINSPNFKLTYDCNHAYVSRHDPAEFFDKIKNHVVVVHISDAVGVEKEQRHLPIGKGIMNFAPIFKLMKSSKFNGSIIFETRPWHGKVKESLSQIREFLK